jgi:nitrite reductase/ring-hydroxylating ferredoxin subunit
MYSRWTIGGTMTISRREFMRLTRAAAACAWASVLGLGGCAGTARIIPLVPHGSYRREGDSVIVALSEVDQLRAVGGAVRLTLDEGETSEVKMLVVRSEGETYRAYANRCTHRGRELDYLHEGRRLQCRSRKAHFDLDGRVLKGPPENGLLVYPSRREGDDLVIEV